MLLWASTTRLCAADVAFTVLPPTEAVHLERLCSREGPGRVAEGWQPTSEEIAQAEAVLPKFVRANGRPRGPLSSYRRQYLGVVIGGRRLIYVNVFREWVIEGREPSGPAQHDWRTQFVRVCDGGDDFWGALYDPHTRRFFSPRFNGTA
jgi:hypothetical protein